VSGTTPVRTAVVLGGASDIGRAVLDALVHQGLEHVVLAVRRPEQVAPLASGSVTVTTVAWDALDVAAHDDLFDAAAAELGRIDLVVCAVGLLGHHAGVSMGPEQVDEMVRTNFAGPAAALSVAARRLRAQGSGALVVFSSVAGVRPRRSNYVYGSTKSGLDAFTRGIADALVGTGVTVLVVRPGFVRSSMTEGLDPAPFSTDPATVGAAVARALARGRSGVVWVPPVLGPLFAVLSVLPAALWRRIAGDR
jgi:NAD(P)-dependent dehydrogenase (short-subunit alcohol dehydrogenase family)